MKATYAVIHWGFNETIIDFINQPNSVSVESGDVDIYTIL